MLKILKASAGSGKTYRLALEYIRILMKDERPDTYRHLLAVTFTNKATEEMKRRILKELDTLARNPEASPYLEELQAEFPDPVRLQKRAAQQLSAILNDYSAFAVSTIDRFFQQTLRAFSREIGQFSTYQVQLDREELVSESVDRVLDGLSEEADKDLLDWLTRSVKTDLEQEGRFSLEGRLQEMAKSLLKRPSGELFEREQLVQLRKQCDGIEREFLDQVGQAAHAVADALADCRLDAADTSYGFIKAVYKYLEPDGKAVLKRPSDSFMDKAANPEKWFSKAKQHLLPQVEASLKGPLDAFLALFGQPHRLYLTVRIIRRQIYSLGVARELRDAFTAIQQEKNVISIDDTNTILHHIIDGTDTPFIYEKLGVRYEDFLLDEFQDTSAIQWENLRPLLHGSVDSGNDSLVVGDVKQSIYRWRGSDWTLLGSELAQEFRDADVDTLKKNYRTCREIVSFNNRFFAYAADELDRIFGQEPASAGSFSALYADVAQLACFRDPAPGSVEVSFVEDQMAEIFSTLDDLRSRGAAWSDIAILVRENAGGAAVAAELIGHRIPVVSDDSLYVKTAVTVRRLVSQLALLDTPEQPEKPTVAGYMAREMDVHLPERYHSLLDLAEAILRDLRSADSSTFDAEIPYIQAFMDYLQDWVSTGGNNLAGFLKAWADATPRIASPRTGDAVRVMTVHKAKGLEFPFVIFPFAEKVKLYKHNATWCRPGAAGTALEPESDALFWVDLTEDSAQTLFSDSYHEERRQQAIDNINVFYVALTRPQYGLKVIAQQTTEGKTGDLSRLLRNFLGTDHYEAGEKYDFSTLKHEETGPGVLECGYPSFPADAGSRLRFSPDAMDYFGDEGRVGAEASRRIRGNVLHGILAHVTVPSELPDAVEAAVGDGELPASLKERTLAFLKERLDAVEERGWFSPGARVLNERAVLGTDGREYRPDRVVLHPDGCVSVVDFKFGKPEDGYLYQVRRYVRLYRQMGYQKVAGYLWYLEDNLIIFADES